MNRCTDAVKVTSFTIAAENGWKLVPYRTEMADEKVDSKLIGFTLNDVETTVRGSSETLVPAGDWTVGMNGTLPLTYDAVVSALSQPVEEQVLSVVFVLEWQT